MRELAIALVHYPVLDGQGDIVTTAVTNLDVHDLARSARTYGVTRYFIVHPITAQRELVARIVGHWTDGSSGKRIPDRKEALSIVKVVPALEDATLALAGPEGRAVETWVTTAREVGSPLGFDEARARLEGEGDPVLLVFGTGWGLAKSVLEKARATLAPIRARRPGYNHLSVRAACAIALDRLLGEH